MTDLIKRIDDYMQGAGEELATVILNDCKAAIEAEYAPMADGEVDMFLYSNFSEDRITLDDYRVIEAEVIKRAGLRIKEQTNER